MPGCKSNHRLDRSPTSPPTAKPLTARFPLSESGRYNAYLGSLATWLGLEQVTGGLLHSLMGISTNKSIP